MKLLPSIVTCAPSPMKSPMKSPMRSATSPTLDDVLNSLLGLSAADTARNGISGGCTLRRPTSQPSIHRQRCTVKDNVPEARSFNDIRSASNSRWFRPHFLQCSRTISNPMSLTNFKYSALFLIKFALFGFSAWYFPQMSLFKNRIFRGGTVRKCGAPPEMSIFIFSFIERWTCLLFFFFWEPTVVYKSKLLILKINFVHIVLLVTSPLTCPLIGC